MSTKLVSIEVYTAVSPFVWDGLTYEVGEEFELPAGWKRDLEYEKLLKVSAGKMVFLIPGIPETKNTNEVSERRMILPVVEAAAPAPEEKQDDGKTAPKGKTAKRSNP